MKKGILFLNNETDRYDILFDNGTTYDGLHCGECFEIYIEKEWKSTRIEYGSYWFLVGIKNREFAGCPVRI